MNTIIIEDENLAAEKLELLLHEIDPNIQVIAKIESVIKSINWLTTNPEPDLIFLDVQLEDGVCFEIFENVKIKTPIIFTTAFDEYAIKAFSVNSIDYLLKPIDKLALYKALEKLRSLNNPEKKWSNSTNSVQEKLMPGYKTRFFVKIGTHYYSISINDIQCFFIQERSTFIKTIHGKKYDIDYSLDKLQTMIDPADFFRINRNYIININSIQEIFSYSSNRLAVKLKMMDHLDMVVSRDKVTEFKEWLDR